eukprot:152403-Rhodomonas_salina.1
MQEGDRKQDLVRAGAGNLLVENVSILRFGSSVLDAVQLVEVHFTQPSASPRDSDHQSATDQLMPDARRVKRARKQRAVGPSLSLKYLGPILVTRDHSHQTSLTQLTQHSTATASIAHSCRLELGKDVWARTRYRARLWARENKSRGGVGAPLERVLLIERDELESDFLEAALGLG